MMSAVRSRENAAEVALRKVLWRRGFRYRLYTRMLLGRPDIVFPSAKVAVFVDGDFWHGRALVENGEGAFRATLRTSRREWWIAKLKRNVARDEEVTSRLRSQGWRVVRLWESSIKANPDRAADRVESALGASTKKSRG